MRQLIIVLFLLISLSVFTQNKTEYIEEPNMIEQNYISFYENSWKPFNGNIIRQNEKPTYVYKGKVRNGIEYYAEVYDENDKLVDILEKGINIQLDNITSRSKFEYKDKFTDINELNVQSFKLHYNQDFETGVKEKLNGIVKFENQKYFYSKGALIKIETFYDENCTSIKDSHEIFSTEFGNLFDVDLESTYHGKYILWNKDGKIVDSGKYELENKTK